MPARRPWRIACWHVGGQALYLLQLDAAAKRRDITVAAKLAGHEVAAGTVGIGPHGSEYELQPPPIVAKAAVEHGFGASLGLVLPQPAQVGAGQ